ncbi:hypothetical protein WDU94_013968 [Cyamophila willieti]
MNGFEKLNNLNAQEEIISGDFNCRISDTYLDESPAEDLGLLSHRVSLDELSNTRGDALVEFMESWGLINLNGRTEGDIPGQFTYISTLGKSVIDLVWCNLQFCQLVGGLHVTDFSLTSDHLPITVKCLLPVHSAQDNAQVPIFNC